MGSVSMGNWVSCSHQQLVSSRFLLLVTLVNLFLVQFTLIPSVEGQFLNSSEYVTNETALSTISTNKPKETLPTTIVDQEVEVKGDLYEGKQVNVDKTPEPGDLESGPIVSLPQGTYRGYTETALGVRLNVFKGIPYADPPIGEQRFRPSRVISTISNKTFQATDYGPNCWEPPMGPLNDIRRSGNLMVRSEDCLHLNIWTPVSGTRTARGSKLKPVFIYVHGGVLIMYSAADSKWTDGRSLAAFADVVVVTPNYRLGTLGFLFSGDSNAPGNLGLTDQRTMLQWINKNIHHFGGDPNRVVLYGMSSGALTVSMLFLSGQINGLISGLVPNSGGPSPLWADSREQSLSKFQLIASKVGCYAPGTVLDTNSVVACLRGKPPLKLTLTALDPELSAITGTNRPEPFFPTLGSDLFPQTSIDQLFDDRKWSANTPVLIWIVTDEGYAPSFYGQFPKLVSPTVAGCSQHLITTRKTLLPAKTKNDLVAISDVAKTYCKGFELNPGSPMLANFNHLLGDWYITCPALYFADILATHGRNPVYFGKFTYYNGSFIRKYFSPDFSGGIYGARHGLDKIYAMGTPYTRPDEFSDSDRTQSSQLMDIYSRFAYTGDPGWTPYKVTSNGRVIPFMREVNSLKEIKYTSINHDRVKCFVWNDIFHDKY